MPSSTFYRLIKLDTDNKDYTDSEVQARAFPFTAHGCSLGHIFWVVGSILLQKRWEIWMSDDLKWWTRGWQTLGCVPVITDRTRQTWRPFLRYQSTRFLVDFLLIIHGLDLPSFHFISGQSNCLLLHEPFLFGALNYEINLKRQFLELQLHFS